MEGISSVSIVGTGNVASHLAKAISGSGIRIEGVFGRNAFEASELAEACESYSVNEIRELKGDLILICVSDFSVVEIINSIPDSIKVAYTSGSIGLSDLRGRKNTGVFYPLQTFTKEKSVNMFEVPFLIEADSEYFAQELFDIAWKLSHHVVFANSEQRKKYHLAAVWMNNFTNHMAYQAKRILDQNELDYQLLLPLLEETANKLKTMDPFDAQTGPARRNDLRILDEHKALLNGLTKEMYDIISKSIIQTYLKDDQL